MTVTAKGLKSGTATVHLDEAGVDAEDDLVLGSGSVSDGKATVDIDTESSKFVADANEATAADAATGMNTIVVFDASGTNVGTAVVGILPTVELDVSEVKRSGVMGVKVSDWYFGDIDSITVGGRPVMLRNDGADFDGETVGSDDKADFKVIVPPEVRLGEQEVTVVGTTDVLQGKGTDTDDKITQKINVGTFDLTVTPASAVTHQVIRIEGSGFGSRACITSITVSEQEIDEATSGIDVVDDSGGNCVKADSNGNLADSFRVPKGLKAGTYRLVVRDDLNRVGEANIVVPKPTITLDPASSQRGTTVTVVGRYFPAEDLITVSYDGSTVTATTTDTVGSWRSTFVVPADAPIGKEQDVIAASSNKADGDEGEATLSAKMKHEVPDEILIISPTTVAPGTRLTVTAGNLPLYTPVSITIGGIGAAGRVVGDDAATDGNGAIEEILLVPQLTPGTHTVELRVHQAGDDEISVARFVEIADIVTRPSDEAFADIITNGTLTRVWHLDAATQTWSFFDPASEFADFNTLTHVSSGQIVTIIMSAQDSFQGKTLYVGSNNVSIE